MNKKLISALLLSVLATQGVVLAQDEGPNDSTEGDDDAQSVVIDMPESLLDTQNTQSCVDYCLAKGNVFCRDEDSTTQGSCYEKQAFQTFLDASDDQDQFNRSCSSGYPNMPSQACPYLANQCGASQLISLGSKETSITPKREFGQFAGSRCAYQFKTSDPTQIFVKTLKNTLMQVYVVSVNETTSIQAATQQVYEGATIAVFGESLIYVDLIASDFARSDFHLVSYPNTKQSDSSYSITDPLAPETTQPISLMKRICAYTIAVTTVLLFLLIIYGLIESSLNKKKFELDTKKESKKANKVKAWYDVQPTEERENNTKIVVEPASPDPRQVSPSTGKPEIKLLKIEQAQPAGQQQDNGLLGSARSNASNRSKASRRQKKGLGLDWPSYMQLVEGTIAEIDAVNNPQTSRRDRTGKMSSRLGHQSSTNVTGAKPDENKENGFTLPPIGVQKTQPIHEIELE